MFHVVFMREWIQVRISPKRPLVAVSYWTSHGSEMLTVLLRNPEASGCVDPYSTFLYESELTSIDFRNYLGHQD